MENKDKIKCELCEKKFYSINASHLKRMHNITISEYKEMFPYAELISEKTRIKLSNNCKEQNKNLNFGFKDNHIVNKDKIPWNKGLVKETDERIERGASKIRGRTISFSTKSKMSKNMKQRYKDGKMNVSGKNNGMFGKKLSEEHKSKLLKARHNYQKINKIETSIYKTLIQYGFIYTGDRKLWLKFKNGKHKNPDFVIENLKVAVEVFGDYWHKNDNPDELINCYNEIGWTCFVIWEHDVEEFCPEKLEQLLNIFEVEDFRYEDFNGKWML